MGERKKKWEVQPPCMSCDGACCKRWPSEPDRKFVVPLTEGKDDFSRYQTMDTELGPAIPYDERGMCPYLKDDRCSIYPDRPWRCRLFNCVWHYEVGGPGTPHTPFLQASPKVLRLVQITLGIADK